MRKHRRDYRHPGGRRGRDHQYRVQRTKPFHDVHGNGPQAMPPARREEGSSGAMVRRSGTSWGPSVAFLEARASLPGTTLTNRSVTSPANKGPDGTGKDGSASGKVMGLTAIMAKNSKHRKQTGFPMTCSEAFPTSPLLASEKRTPRRRSPPLFPTPNHGGGCTKRKNRTGPAPGSVASGDGKTTFHGCGILGTVP